MIRDPRSSYGFRAADPPRDDYGVLAQRIEAAKELIAAAGEALERAAVRAFLAVRRLARVLPDRRVIRVLWRALRARIALVWHFTDSTR